MRFPYLTVLVAVLVVAVVIQTVVIAWGDRSHRIALSLIETAHRISRASIDSQLRQIHTLVNSDMTAARQGELNQTSVTVIVLKRLRALDEAAGRATIEDDLLIANTEARAEELRGLLADRRIQQLADERQQLEEMQNRGLAPVPEGTVDPI